MAELRKKWDKAFSPRKVRIFARVFSACCIFFATFALAQLFPFIIVFSNPGIAAFLLALVLAGAMLLNQNLGVLCFACVLLLAMPAGQPAAALFAAVLICLVCGNARFICCLAVLVPWLTMNLPGDSPWMLSIGLVYFIFFVCAYFNGRIANHTWKYCFPVYYSLVAYNFGVYSAVKDNYIIRWSEDRINADDFNAIDYFIETTGFDTAFSSLNFTELSIIILVNLAVCFILYRIIDNKSLKFLSMPVDVRDGIAFAVGIALICVGSVAIENICVKGVVVGFGGIIVQGAAAYLLTRPLASYDVCRSLESAITLEDETTIKNTLDVNEYGMSMKASVLGVIRTYLSKKEFDNILMADQIPVNCILVIGGGELDLSLAVRNVLKDEKVNAEYYEGKDLCEEFLSGEESRCFRDTFNHSTLNVIVVNNIDEYVSSDEISDQMRKLLLGYLQQYFEKKKRDRNVLFIFTAHRPDTIPECLFNESGINKIIDAKISDSILLNNTYRLIRTLGKGGGGLVYKANHERLDTPVVVKQIISDSIGIKAEADILKNLKHTYIPKVYDVFEEDHRYYTVMDYVPGEDMQAVIDAKGKIDSDSVIKWGIQLADAVAYLHAQTVPILHSDIKPGNVMLMPDGNISLIDFNLSLAFGKHKESVGVTLGYAPIEQYGSLNRYLATLKALGVNDSIYEKQSATPEEIDEYTTTLLTTYCKDGNLSDAETEPIIREIVPNFDADDAGTLLPTLKECAARGLSKRSDIYSIGATLYAMVTGVRPLPVFGFVTPVRELTPDCNGELCSIIQKAMNIDPDDRYASAEEFREALASIQVYGSCRE